ncbi:MAG: metal ABC transporter permease [Planctomycetia bacterium]|nr:MAG: metal ABC transporter permease [Planctomycetia bacterium]
MIGLIPADFAWRSGDTWTVVVGALAAAACALPGNFLVLRRLSLMGDAISHAVLPGLAAAFLISGSLGGVEMLIGAAVVGVLTAALTQWLHSVARVEESAALGVVFSVLFALGLVLIRQADSIDLDPDCVLYGQIETAVLRTTEIGGWQVPEAALTLMGVLMVNVLVIALLFKELRLAAFDPALAAALGFRPLLLHYALMTLVAMTTVAAFESVGSILVIAMLIVPAAAARLLTDRLLPMLLLSGLIAVIGAAGGHLLAIVAPGWFGYPGVSTSTAGMICVAVGLQFGLALLIAPRHGLIVRSLRRANLRARILREDILGVLYRVEESGREISAAVLRSLVRAAVGSGPLATRLALAGLKRRGMVRGAEGRIRLTEPGSVAARSVVRAHRLWEVYLSERLGLRPDHVHGTAERLEHLAAPGIREVLAGDVGEPARDPHGTEIPRGE